MMGEKSGRYLALLRGVNNAGRGKRVAMADLRAVFESLGFRDVRTLLNRGNVVFSAPTTACSAVRARIEQALALRLRLTLPVIVLSADEVATAVHDNPLSQVATHPSHLLVVAPQAPSDLALLKPLLQERWGPEVLALGDRVAYLWCARGVAKSPLWAAVDRALGRMGTARNIATLTKAAAMACT